MTFSHGHLSRVDETNSFVTINVGNDDEPLAIRVTGGQKPMLLQRMIWVIDCQRERISEGARRFVESDTVLGLVPLVFLRIDPIRTPSLRVYL